MDAATDFESLLRCGATAVCALFKSAATAQAANRGKCKSLRQAIRRKVQARRDATDVKIFGGDSTAEKIFGGNLRGSFKITRSKDKKIKS